MRRDELLYELMIRGEKLKGVNYKFDDLRAKLRKKMARELAGEVFEEEYEVVIADELVECELKLQEVREGMDEPSMISPLRVKTVLFHLNGRLTRLLPLCYGHNREECKRLMKLLKDRSNAFKRKGQSVACSSSGRTFLAPSVVSVSTVRNVAVSEHSGPRLESNYSKVGDSDDVGEGCFDNQSQNFGDLDSASQAANQFATFRIENRDHQADLQRQYGANPQTQQAQYQHQQYLQHQGARFNNFIDPIQQRQGPEKVQHQSTFQSTLQHQLQGRREQQFIDRPHRKDPQFHKWKLTFSGDKGSSVNNFIQKVEEIAESRGVETDQLFRGAIEFFTDHALLWFRTIRSQVSTWEELKAYLKNEYLPVDYYMSLWDEIRSRKQGRDESVSQFISCMLGLFERLGHDINEAVKLEHIIRNLAPFYIQNMPIETVISVAHLKTIARNADVKKHLMERNDPERKFRGVPLEPDLAYKSNWSGKRPVVNEVSVQQEAVETAENSESEDGPVVESIDQDRPKLVCWNCRKEGHRFTLCPEKKQVFCHKCGKPQVITKNCPNCVRSGSGKG